MTKPKRPRVQQAQHTQAQAQPSASHGAGRKHRKMSSFAKLSTKSNSYNAIGRKVQQHGKSDKGAQSQKKQPQKQQKQQQNRRPIVPFRRRDRILCIGEGDFSFAHSLVTHHRCKNLLATCYDSQGTLYGKYPQVEKNIAEILAASSSLHDSKDEKGPQQKASPKILFSVDARKLGSPSGGGKDVRFGLPRREKMKPAWKKEDSDKFKNRSAGGPWDVICFNFPHVGGLSTDVNRQVRANQELLVAFFKACVPLLAGKPDDEDKDENGEDDEEGGWDFSTEGSDKDEDGDESDGNDGIDNNVRVKDERRTESGQILVTLFEGEPYTLWNIRDLARHAGLKVVTSFRFPWACYRGYSHARTIGEIEGKDGGRGGWRGEDREARTYVFEVKTDDNTPLLRRAAGKRKKRSAEPDDSDSD
ncbi:hypothetical protein BJY01DRAFT_156283 [Aspergillus pseudoustus]|uniref:25S rRNA (uridine-N(3))-methyltransferase BMT5-like domain-containing protein n=1 Tax=Aspergillus pseudoustus TaxID=1810923 RepID=A0ABR4K838_9EURO